MPEIVGRQLTTQGAEYIVTRFAESLGCHLVSIDLTATRPSGHFCWEMVSIDVRREEDIRELERKLSFFPDLQKTVSTHRETIECSLLSSPGRTFSVAGRSEVRIACSISMENLPSLTSRHTLSLASLLDQLFVRTPTVGETILCRTLEEEFFERCRK